MAQKERPVIALENRRLFTPQPESFVEKVFVAVDERSFRDAPSDGAEDIVLFRFSGEGGFLSREYGGDSESSHSLESAASRDTFLLAHGQLLSFFRRKPAQATDSRRSGLGVLEAMIALSKRRVQGERKPNPAKTSRRPL